jgi:hypothetical protein
MLCVPVNRLLCDYLLQCVIAVCEVLNLPGPSADAPSVLVSALSLYCAPTNGGMHIACIVWCLCGLRVIPLLG